MLNDTAKSKIIISRRLLDNFVPIMRILSRSMFNKFIIAMFSNYSPVKPFTYHVEQENEAFKLVYIFGHGIIPSFVQMSCTFFKGEYLCNAILLT